MGITENHVMESLSRAYVQAIAGYARLNLSLTLEMGAREFDYGVDGTFRHVTSIHGRLVESGFPLDFQLKATTNWQADNNHITYIMDAWAYNKIVDRNNHERTTPQILILLCLPPSSREWLENNEEQLLLRRCCYWLYPTGERTKNKSGVTIKIPRTQILNGSSLVELIKKVELNEFKC
jgi:hypothetical protein